MFYFNTSVYWFTPAEFVWDNATHTPADLGAHTNQLVGVKAVGRLPSVGVCTTLCRLLHQLTLIQMLNQQSGIDMEVFCDNWTLQVYVQ